MTDEMKELTRPTAKRCTRCGDVKPIDKFGKNRRNKDGYMYRCKECESKRQSDWRKDRKLQKEERSAWNAKDVELRHKVPRCQAIGGDVQQIVYMGCRCKPGQKIPLKYTGSSRNTEDENWVDTYEGECLNCNQAVNLWFRT